MIEIRTGRSTMKLRLKLQESVNQKVCAGHGRCRYTFSLFWRDDLVNNTRKLTLAAMFLALGQVLPFITGQIPQIGAMLLPMHFPVFLCAFFCGPQAAAVIGFICPLLRGVLFGMPVLIPNGTAMAFELMTYGFVTGHVYRRFRTKTPAAVYTSLVCGMLAGRVVWGIAEVILLGLRGTGFTVQMFLAGAFLNALPGIIAQLILIPLIVNALASKTIQ